MITVLLFIKLGTALSIRNIRVQMSVNLCNVNVMMTCGGVETVLWIYFNRPVYIIHVEKGHPWEATSCSASQKIYCSFCGPKLYCCVHKSPPLHCRRSKPQSAFSIFQPTSRLNFPSTSGLRSGLFPAGVPAKTLYAHASPPLIHRYLYYVGAHNYFNIFLT